MRCAICDDNIIEVKIIEERLKAEGITVDLYDSGKALADAYRDEGKRYDAVFLDIEMKGLDGFHTADTIYAIDDTVLIVFVTSHHEYVEEWFKFSGVWFLHKPVKPDDLDEALAHLKKLLAKRRQTYTFSDSRQSVRLRCEDILYFEAQGHSVIIHTKTGPDYTIYKNLKDIAQELAGTFCRVHDSFLVNMQHLRKMSNEERITDAQGNTVTRKLGRTVITLDGCDASIPVGRAYKQNAVDAFMRFQEEKFTV